MGAAVLSRAPSGARAGDTQDMERVLAQDVLVECRRLRGRMKGACAVCNPPHHEYMKQIREPTRTHTLSKFVRSLPDPVCALLPFPFITPPIPEAPAPTRSVIQSALVYTTMM